MDEPTIKRFDEMETKIDAIYKSVEKTRKYFLWSFILGFVTIVLPLIGIALIAPYLFSTLSTAYTGF